jgi:hypothetical protein
MSWIDKVTSQMKIQTGDGKIYTPNWMNAGFAKEYNSTEFNFPNIAGTLVDRRKAQGKKLPIEIYFQGDNHLDIARNFMLSAEDERPWTITHPLYDILTVQPISISVDDSKFNVSKISISCIETIIDTNPKTFIIVEDKITEDVELLNESVAGRYANDVTPTSTDKNKMNDLNESYYLSTKRSIKDNDEGINYFNTFNSAKGSIINATAKPNQAIAGLQAIIQAPALFKIDVRTRLTLLSNSLVSLKTNSIGAFNSLADIPRSIKKLFEANGSAIISGMCLTTANPLNENDYSNRKKVADVIEVLLNAYNEFLTDLDTMQLGDGSNPTDYIPSADTIIDLNELINFTMGNLYNFARNAKQERTFALEDESDIITLAHRLYGLKDDDSTIDELMRNNNFGINSILRINKGTQISYFV